MENQAIKTQTISPNGMIIRKMEMADLEYILQVENECFPDPWTKNNFTSEVLENKHSNPCVVEYENKIVGYAVYWCFDIEAHIANFAVTNKHRRKKIGSLLLEYIFEDVACRNITKIYLEVRASNEAARSLYTKYGFVEDYIRKNYYLKEKDDAILMSLSLKEKIK